MTSMPDYLKKLNGADEQLGTIHKLVGEFRRAKPYANTARRVSPTNNDFPLLWSVAAIEGVMNRGGKRIKALRAMAPIVLTEERRDWDN